MSRIDEALAESERIGNGDGAVSPAPVRLPSADAPLDCYPLNADETRPGPVAESASRVAEATLERVSLSDRCNGAFKGKLVVSRDAPALSIEQYRRLAAALHDAQGAHGLTSLIVTSALPLDGKTLTAINLALTLSESYGRRVLLVDADLRRPSLHNAFQLVNAVGLGQVLRSQIADVPLTNVSKNLAVLTAGCSDSDPMAAITSGRMRSLLDEWEARFEWVILDAPPVALLPDAQLLSRLTHAVIFVIGAGVTPHAVVDRAIAGLGRECILGTVLNRVDPKTIPAMTYYRTYYQASDQRA